MKKPVIHEALFRVLSPLFFGLLVYLMLLLMNNQTAQLNQLFRSQEMYVCMLLALVLFEILRLGVSAGEKRHWSERKRWWLLATAWNSLAVVLVIGVVYSYYVVVIGFAPGQGEIIRFLGLYLPGGWFYLALYASQFYLHKENKEQLAAEQERKLALEQQFSDFSNELSPGLLYKSLEELLLLIRKDKTEADDFVNLLAHHYRYRLLNRQQEVVTLEAEKEAASHYLSLMQKIRRQQIKLQEIPALADDFYLPPGSLQIAVQWLLSNSLHNDTPHLLQLELQEKQLLISLEATESLLPDPDSNYAFARLQRSYQVLSNIESSILRQPGRLTISLPLLQSLAHHP